MIGKSSVEDVTLGNIVINGKEANAGMFIEGKQVQYDFRFVNENNEWKIDLVRLLQIASVGFQQELAIGKMTSNEYVLRSVQLFSRKPLDKDIWNPVELAIIRALPFPVKIHAVICFPNHRTQICFYQSFSYWDNNYMEKMKIPEN